MLDFLTLFVNNFHPIIIVNADWIITAETVQRQRIVLLREGIRAEPAGGARVVESCSEVVVGDCGVEEGLVFLAGEPPPVARVGQGLGGRASCFICFPLIASTIPNDCLSAVLTTVRFSFFQGGIFRIHRQSQHRWCLPVCRSTKLPPCNRN